MHRLFVALRPPRAVRALLIATMRGVDGARWQDDDQLHITLRFIGEVDTAMAEDIAAALERVRSPTLDLEIAGVGVFERRGRVHSLWAGISPHQGITALHRSIDAAVCRVGLEPEHRSYLPHITLARLNAPSAAVGSFVVAQSALRSAPFRLDHFLLFESHLGKAGATYDAVARFPLRR